MMPRFQETFCSQCGKAFGPDHPPYVSLDDLIKSLEVAKDGYQAAVDEIARLSRQLAEAQEARDLNAAALECYSTEQERLRRELAEAQAETELWHSRCIGALWLIPGDVALGRLQEAAKEAAELRMLHSATNPSTPIISAEKVIEIAITIDDHYARLEFLKAWQEGDWNTVREFSGVPDARRPNPFECPMCEYDRSFPGFESGGWLQDNNGPIVSCPFCNPKGEHPRI